MMFFRMIVRVQRESFSFLSMVGFKKSVILIINTMINFSFYFYHNQHY